MENFNLVSTKLLFILYDEHLLLEFRAHQTVIAGLLFRMVNK
jgi:hypothetical protein